MPDLSGRKFVINLDPSFFLPSSEVEYNINFRSNGNVYTKIKFSSDSIKFYDGSQYIDVMYTQEALKAPTLTIINDSILVINDSVNSGASLYFDIYCELQGGSSGATLLVGDIVASSGNYTYYDLNNVMFPSAGKFNITVKAKNNNIYMTSLFSSAVTYTISSKLPTPTIVLNGTDLLIYSNDTYQRPYQDYTIYSGDTVLQNIEV